MSDTIPVKDVNYPIGNPSVSVDLQLDASTLGTLSPSSTPSLKQPAKHLGVTWTRLPPSASFYYYTLGIPSNVQAFGKVVIAVTAATGQPINLNVSFV